MLGPLVAQEGTGRSTRQVRNVRDPVPRRKQEPADLRTAPQQCSAQKCERYAASVRGRQGVEENQREHHS